MNIYEEFFLILGKGMTYLNCKEFFDKESIAYEALETSDILNIKDHHLIPVSYTHLTLPTTPYV